MTITLLLSCHDTVCAVYQSRAEAQAIADNFNDDPFVEPGRLDSDAPYRIETWVVKAEGE